VEIIKYKELLRGTGYLAAHETDLDKATGIYVQNKIITNVRKSIENKNYLDIVKHLVDVAG
jgi:aromatic ring hydroxylase